MAQKFIQTQKLSLAGSGVTSTATSIVLQTFSTPDGTLVTSSDIGTTNFGTFEPGGSKEEIFSFTGVTQNANGTATLTGVTRGLKFVSPYTADNSLRQAHSGGSIVVLSNNPQLLDNFLSADNDETITETYTFTQPNLPRASDSSAPTDDEQFANKKYVDDTATGTTQIDRVVPKATAGETVSAGQAVFFDETDDEWKLANAGATGTSENLFLGVAQGAGVNGGLISGGVMLLGLDSNQTGFTAGDSIFLTDVSGTLGSSAGTKSVQVGYAHSATEIFFSPTNFKTIPIQDEKDAMSGTSGTPSTSNKYVTDDDTDATATASKIARRNATGDVTVPSTPTASTDASSKDYVDTQVAAIGASALLNTDTTGVAFTNSNAENTLYSFSVPADTLSTTNVVRVRIYIKDFNSSNQVVNHIFKLKYGATTVATISISQATASTPPNVGFLEAVLIANGATNAQVGFIMLNGGGEQWDINSRSINATAEGTATEDSTGALAFTITGQISDVNADIETLGATLEILKQ